MRCTGTRFTGVPSLLITSSSGSLELVVEVAAVVVPVEPEPLPVTVPLRGRVIMGEGPRPLPHENQVRPYGAFVLRVAGPEDPANVALVRLVRRAAANFTAPDGLVPGRGC